MLAVIETHPIQYHAPVYRTLQAKHGVPVTVIYGSDFSVRGYRDVEFGAAVTWETDLLAGYGHEFLSHATTAEEPELPRLSADGVAAALRRINPAATLIVGYSPAFHRRAWHSAWQLGRPILFRGETIDDPRGASMRGLVRRAGLALAYRSCARLLFIGERSRRHYQACGVPDERLVFAPYCVDTTPFHAGESDRVETRQAARLAWGIAPDRFVILFSGKLSERKGVDLLPDAVRRLPAALRDRAVLVFVGDGALREDVERLARREPSVPAIFAGVRRQSELSRYYHLADLLALPSRRGETWGLVVNEALNHGLPCVVSDQVGCAPDLIEPGTGRVCQADSVEALSRSLAEGLALCGRLEVRERCRARVRDYSVDAAAEGIAEAYRAVTSLGQVA
jgi:glycosyltransferase involved in cell wall biosynthesis